MTTDDRLERIGGVALSTRETLQASYDIARLAIERGIPGDFVECGVFAGAQSAAMALAIMDCVGWWTGKPPYPAPVRRVHLFDSFEGIPAAGPRDSADVREHLPGKSACPIEYVQARMRDWGIPDELLVYYPGWFDVTIPEAVCPTWVGDGAEIIWKDRLQQIAVLRLDADLYESTRVCMEHLYPLVSPGGWIIIDDFALQGAREAVMEHVIPAPVYWRK